MLHRYSEILRSGVMVADLAIVAAAWLGAYALRFHSGLPVPLGVPALQLYLLPLLVIVPLWSVLLRARGLYEPQRTGSLLVETGKLLHASALGVLLVVALTFFLRRDAYSRAVIGLFSLLSAGGLIGFRVALRLVLRRMRRRGYNLRYALVVGGGPLAAEIVERLHAHTESGIRVVGVLAEGVGRAVAGAPVIGGYSGLKTVLRSERIDQVFVALARDENHHLEKVLADLDDEVVSVKLVPDLMHVMTVRSSVEDLDGLPVINLRESPLVGWAAVQKRAFDLALGGALLLGLSPLMAGIAVAIRAGSRGPVLYPQLRMGLDGRVFRMLKFRSMPEDAESETGPVWATPNDVRPTGLGRWLRRTSLDELPQLWNVVRGDMSLVGPRPERLVFIEEFRREIPGYMLRHKAKAGLTGWAQVHGWRGDTSLHARIEHDLYYIQNWSLALDLRILLLTLSRALSQRNAY